MQKTFKRFLLAACLASTPALAQGVLFTPTAQTVGQVNGTAVLTPEPGAYVTVCLITGRNCTPATVYSDQGLTQPLAQPFQADPQGNIVFWAEPGNYQYTVTPTDGSAPQSYPIGGGSGQAPADGDEVNLSAIGTGDYGARISAANAAYAGVHTIFVISTPGTISTPYTLGPLHGLRLLAPLTISATGTLSTDNAITCSPNALLTSTMPTNSFLFTGAASESERVTISGCDVEGSYNYLFGSAGPTQDVSIHDNLIHNGQAYFQNSASVKNPTLRLSVMGNRLVADQAINAGVLVYGAVQDSIVSSNLFQHTYHGVELFSDTSDGLGASQFPTEAQIATSGVRNVLISNNTCENIGASCAWTSVADRVSMIGNTVNGCGDVGLDAESSSHWLAEGNTVSGCYNGDLTTFYSSYDNVMRGNTVVVVGGTIDPLENAFAIRNSSNAPANSARTQIVGNNVTCMTAGSLCGFGYFEASADTLVDGNEGLDAIVSYAQYSTRFTYSNNHFDFDTNATGIILPNMIGGTYSVAVGNILRNLGSAGGTCLNASSSDYNQNETYSFLGNSCVGGWTNDFSLGNSGGNVANTFVLRNNQLSVGVITTNCNGLGCAVVKTNNYAGDGTTLQ